MINDLIGKNGCYLYKGTDACATSRGSLVGREVVFAPYDGSISSKTCLICRKRCVDDRQSEKVQKAKMWKLWSCAHRTKIKDKMGLLFYIQWSRVSL